MRKTLLIIVAAVLSALGLSACQHQTMETVEVMVTSADWVKPNSANYLMASFRWDALDEDVVDYGTVNAYLIENGRQNLLPYVYPIDYSDYDQDGNIIGDPVIVPENIRFDYQYGVITIIMQDLDGMMPEGDFPTMHFRIVAIGD